MNDWNSYQLFYLLKRVSLWAKFISQLNKLSKILGGTILCPSANTRDYGWQAVKSLPIQEDPKT